MRTGLILALFASLTFAASAQEAPTERDAVEDDGIVRLPGQGELRAPDRLERRGPAPRGEGMPRRFLPAGGLLLSFDSNADGEISDVEIDVGIPRAFAAADGDGDGFVTPLEQQEWANGLPTRDDSLANPARFDPNLDRRASLEEFEQVIRQIASVYREQNEGALTIAGLAAPEPDRSARRDRQRPQPEGNRPPRREGGFRQDDVAFGSGFSDCRYSDRRCHSDNRYGHHRYGGFGFYRINPFATGLTFRLRDETPRAALVNGTWYYVGATD